MQRKSLRAFARTLVKEATAKTPKELSVFMKQVVGLLQETGQLWRWRELEREISSAWKELNGVAKISVVTAHELTAAAKKQLEAKAGGAELVIAVNPKLLGGAIIRADERRLDGTVLGALTRLKQTLLT